MSDIHQLHTQLLKQYEDILPIPTNLKRGDISALAAQWHSHTQEGRSTDWEDLAQRLNVDISFKGDHPPWVTWRISPHKIEIISEMTWGWKADRFHILKGFALQQLYPGQSFELRKRDHIHTAEQVNLEALWFVVGAMMPRPQFEEQAQILQGSIEDLAIHFRTTPKSIINRASSLDIDLNGYTAKIQHKM